MRMFLFLCPILTKVVRFDHYDSSFSDCLSEKSEKISESFFKSVGSYKSFGKVFWARHTTGMGQRGENLLFMSFHANPNEFEFLSPDDDGENEATGNTTQQRDSLILDLYFWKKTMKKKKTDDIYSISHLSFLSYVYPLTASNYRCTRGRANALSLGRVQLHIL